MEFVPSFGVLAAFTIAALILIVTPGPDMTLFLSRALTQGRIYNQRGEMVAAVVQEGLTRYVRGYTPGSG